MSTVDPLNPAFPVNSDKVKQAFDELRALKASVNSRIADIEADLANGSQSTVRVPSPDTLGELPLAALRINKVLFFGATGQPVLLNLGAVTGTPSLIPEDGSVTTAKFAAGAKAPLAVTADVAPWAGITGKPTTVGGFGITDAYTKAQVDARIKPFAAVKFSALGGVVSGVVGSNISSVARTAAGEFTITFTTPAPGDYVISGFGRWDTTGINNAVPIYGLVRDNTSYLPGSCKVHSSSAESLGSFDTEVSMLTFWLI